MKAVLPELSVALLCASCALPGSPPNDPADRIIISGLQKQPRSAMHRMGLLRTHKVLLASNSYMALEKAKSMIA